MPRHVVGVLLAAVLAVSASAVLVRSMNDIHPAAIAMWRCGGAALLLSPWAGRVSGVHAARIFAAGALLALHFTMWFASLAHTSVLRSVVIVATGPVWAGIWEWAVQGRNPGARFWRGLAVALPGVALMSGSEGTAGLYGDGLALIGAWAVAGYLLLGREVRKQVDQGRYFCLVSLSAFAVLVPTCLVADASLLGFDTQTWMLLAAATVGPQLIGHNGFTYAVRWISASRVSAVMLLEPVGATLLAMAVLGEFPPPTALVGGALVVTGVVAAVWE